MFIGHFGVALAAKTVAPKTSLGTLILASQFADLLWPFLLLVGIEHVEIVPGITKVSPFDFTDYPFSHSLLMLFFWSLLVGGIYYGLRRYQRGAFVIAAGVSAIGFWISLCIAQTSRYDLGARHAWVWDCGIPGQRPSWWKSCFSDPDCGFI